MDSAGRLSYNLRVALGHLLLGRHRGLAAAWLRGESLPEEALRKLEIMPEPDGDDELEDQARQLVTALSCLATAELPIIFCFDQIEALQLDPQDTVGVDCVRTDDQRVVRGDEARVHLLRPDIISRRAQPIGSRRGPRSHTRIRRSLAQSAHLGRSATIDQGANGRAA